MLGSILGVRGEEELDEIKRLIPQLERLKKESGKQDLTLEDLKDIIYLNDPHRFKSRTKHQATEWDRERMLERLSKAQRSYAVKQQASGIRVFVDEGGKLTIRPEPGVWVRLLPLVFEVPEIKQDGKLVKEAELEGKPKRTWTAKPRGRALDVSGVAEGWEGVHLGQELRLLIDRSQGETFQTLSQESHVTADWLQDSTSPSRVPTSKHRIGPTRMTRILEALKNRGRSLARLVHLRDCWRVWMPDLRLEQFTPKERYRIARYVNIFGNPNVPASVKEELNEYVESLCRQYQAEIEADLFSSMEREVAVARYDNKRDAKDLRIHMVAGAENLPTPEVKKKSKKQ